MIVGANTVDIVVISPGREVKRTYSITITRATPPSSDASLASLVLGSGTLSPAFDPKIKNYTTFVANSVSNLSITPTASQSGSTVLINSKSTTAVAMAVGENVVNIDITAPDGKASNRYTVTVTKAPSVDQDASLANLSFFGAGTLSRAFRPETTTYTLLVRNAIENVVVAATVNQAGASTKINGQTTTSIVVPLELGKNTLTLLITSKDHATTKTYNITVIRASAVAIAAGMNHNCVLMKDSGGVRCWGDNTYGQLGNGSNTSSDEPGDEILTGAVGIAAGGNHTCAIMKDTANVMC